MHWKLVGREYQGENGEVVGIRDFPFVVSVGDTVEKFGTTSTVSNILYNENGGVMLELTSMIEEA